MVKATREQMRLQRELLMREYSIVNGEADGLTGEEAGMVGLFSG